MTKAWRGQNFSMPVPLTRQPDLSLGKSQRQMKRNPSPRPPIHQASSSLPDNSCRRQALPSFLTFILQERLGAARSSSAYTCGRGPWRALSRPGLSRPQKADPATVRYRATPARCITSIRAMHAGIFIGRAALR